MSAQNGDTGATRAPWWAVELAALAIVLAATLPLLLGRTYFVDDVQRLNMPLAAELHRAVREGEPLWWIPNILGGYCGVGAGQTGTYYPPYLLLHALFPLVWAYKLAFVFHLWLLARGMIGLGLELGLRLPGAIVAAAVATLGGAVSGHHMHQNVIAGMGWTAPILWLTVRVARAERPAAAVLGLGGALAIDLLVAHPQYVWFAILAALCLLPWVRSEAVAWPALAARLVAAGLMAGLLAVAQLLPLAEYVSTYPRPQPGGAFSYLTAFSFAASDWLRLWNPDLFGSPWRGGSLYDFTYWETRGFFAVSLLTLALGWGLAGPRTTASRCGAALALVGAVLMLGRYNPLYYLLVHVPPFSVFRGPGRYVWLLQLGVGLLAGGAADGLGRRPVGRRAASAAVALSALALGVGAVWVATDGAPPPWRQPLFWTAWLGLAAAAAACLPAGEVARRRGLAVALAVGAVELLVSWHTFALTTPDRFFELPPPAAEPVLASDNPRVLYVDHADRVDVVADHVRRLYDCAGTIWGVAYLQGGSEALQPLGHLAVIDDMKTAAKENPELFAFYCRRASVRWVVTAQELPAPTWRRVMELPGAVLYELPDTRPWFYAVPAERVGELGVITRPGDPDPPILPLEPVERGRHRYVFHTAFDRPMAVIVAQSLYNGWLAYVDGQLVTNYGAERLYMGTTVPAGPHVVEFVFDNALIYLGRQLSLAGWAVWLLALAWALAARRRPASA